MRSKKLKNKSIENNLEKSELEIEKLKLEIKNLERKPLLQPVYLSLIPSFLLVIVTIYTLYNSSFFDNEKTLLDLRKEKLRRDIQIFTDQRDSLKNELKYLRDSITTLNSMNDSLVKDKKELLAIINDKIRGQDFYEQLNENDINIKINNNKILTVNIDLKEKGSFNVGRYLAPKISDITTEITKIIENYKRSYRIDMDSIFLQIIGHADGIPNEGIRYENEFGEIRYGNYAIYPSQPLRNRDLAFLRAYGIRQNLIKTNLFSERNTSISIYDEPDFGKIGTDYRKVSLKLTLKILD